MAVAGYIADNRPQSDPLILTLMDVITAGASLLVCFRPAVQLLFRFVCWQDVGTGMLINLGLAIVFTVVGWFKLLLLLCWTLNKSLLVMTRLKRMLAGRKPNLNIAIRSWKKCTKSN